MCRRPVAAAVALAVGAVWRSPWWPRWLRWWTQRPTMPVAAAAGVPALVMTSLTFTNECVPLCYKSTWKRGPSFDSSSHIENKKSAVIQCTEPIGSLPEGCKYDNKVTEPKRNTCSVTLGKTSYTRMYNIPCNTAKKVLGVTAGDQIARVKARRVCKASGTISSSSPKPCSEPYESPMMHDNQRRVC